MKNNKFYPFKRMGALGLFFLFCMSTLQNDVSAKNHYQGMQSLQQSSIQEKSIREVKGKVTDANDGEPIVGCVVYVKGDKSRVTLTDNQGAYKIKGATNEILIFSCIGYEKQEVKLGKSSLLDLALMQDKLQLDDVVVTGYQTISKERAAGSYAIVSHKELQDKIQPNLMSRMEGKIAGLNVGGQGGIRIRGCSTIKGNSSPLYVVDGVPFEGSLSAINSSEIVNVTVLKDATAASIYGARSANGVIVITTKKGEVGPTRVSYSGTVSTRGLPRRGYSNIMNSEELVDYQMALFEQYPNIRRSTERNYQNPVQEIYLDHKDGLMDDKEMAEKLDYYRTHDRYSQVKEEFLRRASIQHQHNLSFSGGNKKHTYNFSANYTGNAPYEKERMTHKIGINLQNSFNFYKWLKVDFGIIATEDFADYDNGVSGMGLYAPSYMMLYDDDGNPVQWYNRKSQFEIDRLNSLGLEDETYYPVKEMSNSHHKSRGYYRNYNLGLKFKFTEDLNMNVRFQTEHTDSFSKQFDSKDALSVKSMINDATIIEDGVPEYLIPKGGQVVVNNFNKESYTFRTQLNYKKNFSNSSSLRAIAGTEVRRIHSRSHGLYRVGYDDQNLSFGNIDQVRLQQYITGTEALFGGFSFRDRTPGFSDGDNRFFSLYANASYDLNKKWKFNGSIRIDQSNLFGTDKKYQYKPLWSLGTSYLILENVSVLDRLVGRLTYGINGNIPKLNGPFLIARAGRNNYYTSEPTMFIQSPPNPALRWEKTKVFNLGFNFSMFKSRLTGSLDVYNKNTTDLLGNFSTDPTIGWSSVNLNFGNMYNRGVELALNSVNVKKNGFAWNSYFTFSYNKNKITRIESSDESASSYYRGLNNRVGYPMGAMFSVRYKGLNENGAPVAYLADGSTTLNSSDLSKDDLVYSGTYNPPYSAALTNAFSYKGFDLSFMLVYMGGNVMRDVQAKYCITYHPIYLSGNTDKNFANFWKKPGDELDPDTNPAFMFQSTVRNGENIWKAADRHVEKGDFIKLRDVTLSYNLPAKLLRNTPIRGIRASMQVRNICYWAANKHHYDPEIWRGSSLSPSRGTLYPAEFIFGLNINF